ncbi:MAG TPA: Ppx/GppA phosphatase family protein [Bosea sp. (in: a-proteobacteria)]|jgi:exopolyphosphatase/guanosine-5'-triphosphate,3'-diphosphate pyrophosphatase|nr:Ppx/GppA phosphatase family protein [Bosea sp. (in: a-proteobacteria)]HEV2513235.1 Ppx/GppA phosphatase family protein [Bosea sp. (in: a-proteobacteria)]
MDRDPAESGAGMPAAADRHPDGKSHQGDGRGKSKRKRRKRRGPVYAPGTGPRAPARPEPAVLVAPAPEVPIPPPKPSANGAARPADFYGALDLGTNNCRLLVAVPRDHGFRVVDAFSRIVRLGEGIGQTGRLGEAAMGRAIEALKVCGQKLAYRDVGRTRMIATEACRIAANGSDFVSRVRDETGLELEIVSRETEARLAVAGCASLVDPNAGGVILFDIGGGSSELVWLDLAGAAGDGRRRRMSDRIREWVSLPVGVVSLSERHGGRDVTPVQFEAMVAEVAVMLGAFPNVAVLDAAVAAGEVHMLGTSGTVTTLAGVHLDLPRYDRRVVDGTWLSGNQVAELVTLFMGMDYEARCANPCIGRERADLVLAGCAILEAIRRRWPCDRLRVADRGLREGVLVELMAEDGVWRPRSGRRAEDAHHA